MWRHVARHRVHRTPRAHRDNPHPSRRARDRRHQFPPAHRRPIPRKPNLRSPHLRPCPDCARRCTTARLRLASRALRPPPPSGHGFMFAGSKSRHLDRDSSALSAVATSSGRPAISSTGTSLVPGTGMPMRRANAPAVARFAGAPIVPGGRLERELRVAASVPNRTRTRPAE